MVTWKLYTVLDAYPPQTTFKCFDVIQFPCEISHKNSKSSKKQWKSELKPLNGQVA